VSPEVIVRQAATTRAEYIGREVQVAVLQASSTVEDLRHPNCSKLWPSTRADRVIILIDPLSGSSPDESGLLSLRGLILGLSRASRVYTILTMLRMHRCKKIMYGRVHSTVVDPLRASVLLGVLNLIAGEPMGGGYR
jgi:hypothetical protein